MKIHSSNNQNFTGAFKFGSIENKSYNTLHHLVPKESSKIFNNVINKGDVVIITHSCYNERIKNFINNDNLKFEYFPNIKLGEKLTKDVLRSLIVRDAAAKETINNPFLLKVRLLKDNISNSKLLSKHMKYILKTLRLNVENPEIKIMSNGLPSIRDNTKGRTIYVSPNYKSHYYVYVKPDSKNQESARYLLMGNGRKLIREFKTPKEIDTFNNKSCIVPDDMV